MKNAEKNVLLLDTETTGLIEGRLIQLAYMADLKTSKPVIKGRVEKLFNPKVPIDFEAMAVHHITQKRVDEDGIDFKEWSELRKFQETLYDNTLVAHNAKFDIDVLEREGVKVGEFICTRKVAYKFLPEAKNHRLQYLRYYLRLDIKESVIAHDAMGDVVVLDALFEHLKQFASIKEMIEISKKPMLIREFSFGKHKGESVESVITSDPGYWKWMLNNIDDLDDDLRYSINYYAKQKQLF